MVGPAQEVPFVRGGAPGPEGALEEKSEEEDRRSHILGGGGGVDRERLPSGVSRWGTLRPN